MARDDRGGLTVLTDAMRLVEGEDDGEEPAAAGATRVVPVEIRCWLTMSQLADLKSRLGIACGKAVDLAVRQGFAGSVAGDDALGLLEQLSGFPQATPAMLWKGMNRLGICQGGMDVQQGDNLRPAAEAMRAPVPQLCSLPDRRRRLEELRLAKLWDRGKHSEDIEALRAAANGGHRLAQCTLGSMHETGTTEVVQDWVQMIELYTAAAERRVEGLVFFGEGVADAQFRLGRCFAEGRGVRRDREMATLWLWRAARQKHERATLYLAEFQQRAHPLYSFKKFFSVSTWVERQPKKTVTAINNNVNGNKNDDQTQNDHNHSMNNEVGNYIDNKNDQIAQGSLSECVAIQKAAGAHVTTLELEARAQARAERLCRRTNAIKLQDQLVDVTFHDSTLGLSLVLATEHCTKRKMIIVAEIRAGSPADGLLEVQDELVAIGDDFELPNHLLIFDEIGKFIYRQPRPLVLTFGRIHKHRPAPIERPAVYLAPDQPDGH